MPKCALLAILLLTTMATGQTAQNDANQRFAALRDAYLAKFKPLFLESETAWWEANITGADAAYARKTAADQALVDLHSDHAVFAQLKELKEAGGVTDPTLRRELDVVYRSFLAGQADPQLQKQIVALENDVEQIFNTHRSPVGDKILTENEVRDILANSTKSADVEAAWKGYMEVGRKADEKLRRLVQLRNEKARQLGFPDFFTLSLALQEIDQAELFKLFDELDALTREPFAQLKADLDKERAARFGIPVAELRPGTSATSSSRKPPPAPRSTSTGSSRTPTCSRSQKRTTPASACPPTTSSPAATCTRSPGSARTRSAPTSTAPATSASSPISSPISTGPTPSCTNSATAYTTSTSTPTCRSCCARRPTASPPRASPSSSARSSRTRSGSSKSSASTLTPSLASAPLSVNPSAPSA
jgi:hypothetical protein